MNKDIYNELGQLTRQLYDVLKELGIGDNLSHSTLVLPDAEDRLLFIARMTEEAAHKVLNHAEESQAIVEKMLLNIPESASPEWIEDYKSNLLKIHNAQKNIIESQEYQDLTGQVLKKMTNTVKRLQKDLAHILLLYQQHDTSEEVKDMDLNITYEQSDVDALLHRLGF